MEWPCEVFAVRIFMHSAKKACDSGITHDGVLQLVRKRYIVKYILTCSKRRYADWEKLYIRQNRDLLAKRLQIGATYLSEVCADF